MENMTEEQLLEIYNDFYKYYSHEEFIEMMIDYEQRKQNQENLIKYIEEELNLIDNVYLLEEIDEDVRRHLLTKEDIFKNLLERIKSNK